MPQPQQLTLWDDLDGARHRAIRHRTTTERAAADLVNDRAIAPVLDLPDADLWFAPRFFSLEESDRLFDILLDQTPWQQDTITLYGQSMTIPRLTAWYGDRPYTYSGITHRPHPWTTTLLALKATVEAAADTSFNSVLLNLYRHGRDSVAWHSDDERELGHNPAIASISLGSERRFWLRHKRDKTLKQAIALPHGSLLVMRGPTQHHWLHAIPKTTKPVAARINLTFRYIVET